MRLSVIIPHFSNHGFLAEALSSVRHYCGTDTEIIVVDDGSPDKSFRSQLNAHIARLFTLPYNQGPSAARNIGVEAATGEYLMFLDSDDYLTADPRSMLDTWEKCAKAQHKGGQPELFVGLTNTEGRQVPFGRVVNLHTHPGEAALTRFTAALYQRTWLHDRDLRFRPDLRLGEDVEFLMRALASAQNFVMSNTRFYFYRRREGSLTAGHYDRQRLAARAKLTEAYAQALDGLPDALLVRLTIAFRVNLDILRTVLGEGRENDAHAFVADLHHGYESLLVPLVSRPPVPSRIPPFTAEERELLDLFVNRQTNILCARLMAPITS